MSDVCDVFLSYKREDKARVRRLHAALVRAGLSVWWDRDTPGGAEWGREVEEKLTAAQVVMVVWSASSTGPDNAFVRDEARRGLSRGVLLPVHIDRVVPPLGFGEFQSLDLVGWRGRQKDARFADVLAAIDAIVHGRRPPPPRWPSVRRRRNIVAWAATIVIGGMSAGFAHPATRCGLCSVPTLGALCRATGIGQGEKIEWRNKVEALSETIAPNAPFATDGAAQADAQARGDEYARKTVCAPFAEADWQLLSASARPTEWRCATSHDGVRCGFSGSALCNVKQKVLSTGNLCE